MRPKHSTEFSSPLLEFDIESYTKDASHYLYLVRRLDSSSTDEEWLPYNQVSHFSAFQEFAHQNGLIERPPIGKQKKKGHPRKDILKWNVVPDEDFIELLRRISMLHDHSREQQMYTAAKIFTGSIAPANSAAKEELDATDAQAAGVTMTSAAASIATSGQGHVQPQEEEELEQFGPDNPWNDELRKSRMSFFEKIRGPGSEPGLCDDAPMSIIERFKKPANSWDVSRWKGWVKTKTQGKAERFEFCCDFCSTFYPNFPFKDIEYKRQNQREYLIIKFCQPYESDQQKPFSTLHVDAKVWVYFRQTNPPSLPSALHLKGNRIHHDSCESIFHFFHTPCTVEGSTKDDVTVILNEMNRWSNDDTERLKGLLNAKDSTVNVLGWLTDVDIETLSYMHATPERHIVESRVKDDKRDEKCVFVCMYANNIRSAFVFVSYIIQKFCSSLNNSRLDFYDSSADCLLQASFSNTQHQLPGS